jgi:Flp pilus assembly secretin CpaC
MSLSGFWQCCVIVAVALLAGNASAAPPQEVTASETVSLYVGQSRTFMFDEPVTEFKLVTGGTAEAMPLTDRTFTIRGLNPGDVLGIAYGQGNRVLHRMKIVVMPAHVTVKIYGANQSVGGYASYYCEDDGCSRANPDVAPLPFSTSTSETHQKGNGDSESVERVYR